MTVHLNTFFLWLGMPGWLTDAIAFLLANYVFLIISRIVVYGTFAVFKPSLSTEEDQSGRVRQLVTMSATILISQGRCLTIQPYSMAMNGMYLI